MKQKKKDYQRILIRSNIRINNVSVALTFLQDLGVRIYGCNAQGMKGEKKKQKKKPHHSSLL